MVYPGFEGQDYARCRPTGCDKLRPDSLNSSQSPGFAVAIIPLMLPTQRVSRRQFLSAVGTTAVAPAFLGPFYELAASERKRAKIRAIQVMVMQGPRTYTLVKVISDAGVSGIGESYGSPGAGVKEQILVVKPALIGKDPLDIDTLFSGLGNRTDGSAHSLMRAISGIEMAVWD